MKRFIVLLIACFFVSIALASTSFAGTKTLTFMWEQVISTDFAGWKLYGSTSPNVQAIPGNLKATIPYSGTPSTTYTSAQPITVPDNAETRMYFVLTAFDHSNQESGVSNEVNALLDFLAPAIPQKLNVTVQAP